MAIMVRHHGENGVLAVMAGLTLLSVVAVSRAGGLDRGAPTLPSVEKATQ